MLPLKLIFKGRLEFGSQRTFDMVLRHWQTRLETYFKNDVLFKPEQLFVAEDFALVVPQQTIMSAEKPWRSTTALLEEVAQFAVAGHIRAWCVDNGRLVADLTIESSSDKAAVTEYLRGRDLVGQQGREGEATAALSRAIEKFERHALAYERRGYVNYKLKNFNDALHDFTKSIAINPNNPEPYYGSGKVKMLKNDWEGAIVDLDQAVKRSLALQPLHWLARLKKGESLFRAKKYAEAAQEMRLYLLRTFAEDDPNYRRRRRAAWFLGKALLELNDAGAALAAFDQTLEFAAGAEFVPDAEGLLYRGIAKRQAGKPEFTHDLEAAAQMGSAEAERLLAEWR